MHILALFPFRTEATQVVYTQDTTHVAVLAEWTMPAEAPVVPGTVLHLGFRVDMQERALLVTALTKFGVEVTLRHFRHVKFMKKLAVIAFFTQSS